MTFQPANSSPDGYFSYSAGSQVYPLPDVVSNPTPTTLLGDQLLYQIGTFFQQILNSNLLPRFAEDMLAIGVSATNVPTYQDGYAAAQVVDYPLYPHILSTNAYKFPLISVVQTGLATNQHTIVKVGMRRDIKVSWILPPMTGSQSLIFQPYLAIAAKAWADYAGIGYDPKVNTQSIWLTAGVVDAILGEFSFAPFQGQQPASNSGWQQVAFPAMTFSLSVWEDNQLGLPQNALPDFVGGYIQVNLADGYNVNNPLDNIADGYAYPNLSLTSLSTSTGSVQGETLVFISGQGFVPQNTYTITFNGAVANAIATSVRNTQMLQTITNPAINATPGVGNVVVTDQFGHTAILINAWEYTTP